MILTLQKDHSLTTLDGCSIAHEVPGTEDLYYNRNYIFSFESLTITLQNKSGTSFAEKISPTFTGVSYLSECSKMFPDHLSKILTAYAIHHLGEFVSGETVLTKVRESEELIENQIDELDMEVN
jgi:hypothetical protein